MMAKNPHFRVLALTATPGSSQEAIQGIVDCLHISRIEIRDEGSLDLREYMHKKASRCCHHHAAVLKHSVNTGSEAAYYYNDWRNCPLPTVAKDCDGG